MPLLDQFRRHLKRQRLLRGGERVVVAVSGGPDSLCLLHLLWRLRDELGLHLHVAHLDHGFRGAESAAEARFVTEVAAQLGIESTVELRDVTEWMHGQTTNKLSAARAVRYTFLAEVAQHEGADAVAVAHHADDQAETVLMHMLRGGGPAGLRGMRERVPWAEWAAKHVASPTNAHPTIIRPLLATSRADIEAYCVEHALDPRHDPSNTATTFTRARVRYDLLPQLREYNSHISTALAHTASICAEDYDYVQQQLDACWPTLVREEVGRVLFDRALWNALHPALQRYALRRAMNALTPKEELRFEQIDALRFVVRDSNGARPNLPNDVRLLIEADSFSLVHPSEQASAQPIGNVPQLVAPIVVGVPGITPINQHWQLVVAADMPEGWRDDHWHLAIDHGKIVGSLVLRTRQAGDRFRPEGGPGSKRLQDFFVDTKLPRELRDGWPLLTSGDQIVWVVGLRPDSRFRPDPATQRRLWLSVEEM